MLTSIVATDRDEIKVSVHGVGKSAWVGIQLDRTNVSDLGWAQISISIAAARALVELLPDAIKDAEQLAAQPAAEASDA